MLNICVYKCDQSDIFDFRKKSNLGPLESSRAVSIVDSSSGDFYSW